MINDYSFTNLSALYRLVIVNVKCIPWATVPGRVGCCGNVKNDSGNGRAAAVRAAVATGSVKLFASWTAGTVRQKCAPSAPLGWKARRFARIRGGRAGEFREIGPATLLPVAPSPNNIGILVAGDARNALCLHAVVRRYACRHCADRFSITSDSASCTRAYDDQRARSYGTLVGQPAELLNASIWRTLAWVFLC